MKNKVYLIFVLGFIGFVSTGLANAGISGYGLNEPQESEDSNSTVSSSESDEQLNYGNTSGGITSAQLTEYKEAVSYLHCVYSGSSNCGVSSNGMISQYSDTAQARADVERLKELEGYGLNATKKKELDAAAELELLKISVDEAKAYGKKIMKLSAEMVMEEFDDSALFKTIIIMPDEDSMEKAEAEDFTSDAHNGFVVNERVKTKQEMIDIIKADAQETERYKASNGYLEGVEFSNVIGINTQYHLHDESTWVDIETIKEEDTVAIGMKTNMTTSVKIKRYPELGYAIKIYEYEVELSSKIEEGVYSEDKLPVKEVKVDFDLTNNKIDEQWYNRYDDIKEENARIRDVQGKQRMLEYTADIAERKYEEALELYEQSLDEENPEALEKKYQKLVDDAEDYLKAGEKFYPQVMALGDAKSKEIGRNYIRVKSINFNSMKSSVSASHSSKGQ